MKRWMWIVGGVIVLGFIASLAPDAPQEPQSEVQQEQPQQPLAPFTERYEVTEQYERQFNKIRVFVLAQDAQTAVRECAAEYRTTDSAYCFVYTDRAGYEAAVRGESSECWAARHIRPQWDQGDEQTTLEGPCQ